MRRCSLQGHAPHAFVAFLPASSRCSPPRAARRAGAAAAAARLARACESGPSAAERFAVFTGLDARASPGTRADVDALRPARAARAARPLAAGQAPAFGRWERSKTAGASGFIYTKRVERLKQRAQYRAVVRFRWLDAAAACSASDAGATPVCVAAVAARRTCASRRSRSSRRPTRRLARYLVTVVNDGLVAAGAVRRSALIVGGEEQVRDVPGLAPGGRDDGRDPGAALRRTAPTGSPCQLDVRDVVDGVRRATTTAPSAV